MTGKTGLIFLILAVLGLQSVIVSAVVQDPATMMALPLASAGWAFVAWLAARLGDSSEEAAFIHKVTTTSLWVRLILGSLLTASGQAGFFGGDFWTYEIIGNSLATEWSGGPEVPSSIRGRYLNLQGAGSSGSRAGFYYFVGALFYAFGTSGWITMVVMCLFGALCVPLIYLIGRDMFSVEIGRRAAWFGALFPSIVLWTCMGYKDGLIIFCLLLTYRCVQRLQEQITPAAFIGLIVGMGSIYFVRGYIFYAALGPILLALMNRKSAEKQAFYNQLAGILLLGLAFVASGLASNAVTQLQEVSLKEINSTRGSLAKEANSGFAKEADVSTPGKALAYMPLGISYFVLAPFPWQMTNVRQAITIPEMIVWWSLLPAVYRGVRRGLTERLSASSGIILFLFALTLLYGLTQGNVGTAYRQRAQLLVFYFIFAAAGLRPGSWIDRLFNRRQKPTPNALPMGLEPR